MTYLYHISWNNKDLIIYALLSNTKKYTNNEFNKIVREAILEACREQLKTDELVLHYDTFKKVLSILESKYGFLVLKPNVEATIVIPYNSTELYNMKEDDRLKEFLGNELYNAIKNHNYTLLLTELGNRTRYAEIKGDTPVV